MRGQLEAYFDVAFTAPDGVKRLRELILSLAVQGKLTDQRDSDEPASELLKKIAAEKKKLEKEGKIKKQKPLPPVGDDEKPYTLPKGWEWVRLGDVGEVNPRNKADDSLDAAFVPMASIEAAYNDRHSFEIKKWREIKKGFTHFAEGDIALAKITPCFENRKSCIFRGLPNSIGAGTTELHIFRNNFGTFISQFALCYLKSPNYIQSAAAGMTGTAGQQRVSTNFFANFPVPLPPLAEQQRIVERVNSLMVSCDALETMHKEQERKRDSARAAAMHALTMPQGTTDPALAFSRNLGFLARNFELLFTTKQDAAELRKTILQLAVMGKLTDQRNSDEPASELLKKIAVEKKTLEKEGKIKKQKPLPPVADDEKPYTLPKGWEWCRFQDLILELATGPFGSVLHKTDYVENGTPLINPSHMHNGIIVPDARIAVTATTAAKLAAYRLKTNDIIMARRGELGRCAVVDSTSNGYLCGTGSFILRKSKLVILDFFILIFKNPTVRNYLLGNSVGITMTNLNHTILIKMPVSLPPLAEQQRIVERVNSFMALCDTLEERIEARTQTQDNLLNAVVAMA